MREGQPPGGGGDLQGAPLAAAVPAFFLVAGHRHVAPGQSGGLRVQAGLVALDGDHVMRAAAGKVAGVCTLGVQRVGGNDRIAALDPVQQRGEQRDLVRFGAHLHLAQHRAMRMIEGGQQVAAALALVTRAA